MNKAIAFMPKWKISLYVLFSALLASVTLFILIPVLRELEGRSSRLDDLIELVVSFGIVPVIFVAVILFCGYLYLFYGLERKKRREQETQQMLEEVRHISNGHFDRRIHLTEDPQLDEWASQINAIIDQAEKAIENQKESAKLKNDLITNVAHDLRSPLTSIVGYLDLVNGDQYKDEVELRHYVQIVHDKAAGLHHLINDLFEYTLVQNKESLSNEVPINVIEMMNQLSMQYQYQVQEEGMEIRFFMPVTTNAYVLGDGNKLARVFENLIQNAIRYGKDGRYIDLSVEESASEVEIGVTNYGAHISEAEIPRLFDRFYRVEKSRSQATGGSGLGLAIVKSIIELHGGRIQVQSRNWKTSFIVTIPKYANQK